MRELRLEGAGVLRRGVDDVAAEGEHRVGFAREPRREFRRLGVEADADEGARLVPALSQCLHEVHRRHPLASKPASKHCVSWERLPLFQRLEPQPVRAGVVAQAALLVFFVLAVVALEELHVRVALRSEEHTSELQSLMRISYAVFCLKKKRKY